MFLCIVGTSRCGTTLLRQMMHKHPDLVVFRETHWLPKMVEFFGTQRVAPELLLSIVEKTTWVSGEDLLSVNLAFSTFNTKEELLIALRSEFRRTGYLTIQEFSTVLVRVLFNWKGLWGDKTPDYGFYMAMIQSLWPRCRFIHIIRDGLATARSMAQHRGCQLMLSAGHDNWCSLSYDRSFDKYRIDRQPLEGHVASWSRRLNRIRDESTRLSKNTYMETRYEDLIRDPRSVLSTICSFLGLPGTGDWLESSAAMVRANPPASAVDASFFYRLSAADLLALNQHKSETTHPLLELPADTDRKELMAKALVAESSLQEGLARPVLDLAVQMMATLVCHRERSLLAAAHDLAIRASRRCRDLQTEKHWTESAERYGFAIPEKTEGNG